MSEVILKEIVSELETINATIPSEADFFNIENKLDKLIELMTEQNEISDRISNSLDNISQNIPRESGVSTHRIEDRLEKIWDKLEDVNSNLNDISYNTSE